MTAPAQPRLLTDEQMRRWITDGFLILHTDFSHEFHQQLTEQLKLVYDKEGNPGNNLLPRIRELRKVFEHPVVTGALTSVLGPDYMMHAHRHGHYNAVAKPGNWHKDSYWGYKRQRNHHPWWAMVMYFPQDTPIELGPTGLMPGTQNYETRTFADESGLEAVASGRAGTFALIHYDMWHRSTANVLALPRFMLKFEFMRTAAPTAPSWDRKEPRWRAPESANVFPARHDIMWEETWSWLSGELCSLADTRTGGDSQELQRLERQLADSQEPVALNAAYELSCRGAEGVDALLRSLHDKRPGVSRKASYGLSIAGGAAVAGTAAALSSSSSSDDTVRHAIFALGELRQLAAPAVPAIAALADHPSEKVRQAAAEALGINGSASPEAVAALIRALSDADTQVRFTAGLSLARLGPAAAAAVPALTAALEDDNRYVRAHAAEALRYINTDDAREALIAYLFDTRWCSSTTPASTFYP